MIKKIIYLIVFCLGCVALNSCAIYGQDDYNLHRNAIYWNNRHMYYTYKPIPKHYCGQLNKTKPKPHNNRPRPTQKPNRRK